MSDAEELALLEKHAQDLGEHFDSVQIFATRHDASEGGTINLSYGSGNWFARYGQVADWITKSAERTKECVRHEEND